MSNGYLPDSQSSNNRSSNNRQRWDAGRFLTTLGYFGEIPFLGSFRWLQQLVGQKALVSGIAMPAVKKKVAIFGDISANRLDILRRRLFSVAELSIISSNVSAAELSRLLQLVDVIVVLDLQSFMTDHFYASAVAQADVEDMASSANKIKQPVFNFTDPSCSVAAWGALDDVVMGGVSEGSFFLRRLDEKTKHEPSCHAVFAGNVSTTNSGGFSSVRTQNFEPPFDFSGWAGISLWVKGDAQRYKFILRNSSGWDSPAYMYSFDTLANEWQSIYIPFKEMVPTFRARSVPEAPPLDSQKVFSFQIMLSKFEYDKKLNPNFTPGTFELAIACISVYRPRKSPPLLIVGNRESLEAGLDDLPIDYRLIEVETETSDEAYAEAIAQALL